jgi:hypothetical protein
MSRSKLIYFFKIILSLFFTFSEIALYAQQAATKKNVVENIVLKGNKRTKEHIVMRELSFKKGDSIAISDWPLHLEKSRNNLLNTSLFNFVTIDTVTTEGKTTVSIEVAERWYLWPAPFFQLADRNFNTWWKTKDFSRADYGLYFTQENFRGRKEVLKAVIAIGYDQTLGLSYKIPYINKNKTLGLGFSAGFAGNHEVAVKTDTNEQVFYKDKNKFVKTNTYSTFQITYRNHIYITHTFQLNFNSFRFADSLFVINNTFSSQPATDYFTFYYLLKNDHRDLKAYPLTGYYFDMEFSKSGFGLLKNENIDVASIHGSARKYFKLSKRIFFAAGTNFKLSSNTAQPYFYMRGLGFGGDFVRGYEDYVVDGQSFGVLKTNFKWEVLPTKIKEFKFIPFKKFNKLFYSLYLNVFSDAGYVYKHGLNQADPLAGKMLQGYGVGLDLVTYYDKVFRVEYSVNKMHEATIYLHFVAPI